MHTKIAVLSITKFQNSKQIKTAARCVSHPVEAVLCMCSCTGDILCMPILVFFFLQVVSKAREIKHLSLIILRVLSHLFHCLMLRFQR